MAYKTIISEQKDGVVKITLNRPDKRNAISMEMVAECVSAIKEVESDAGMGAVIITGTGDKAFTAGDDIKSQKDYDVWWNLNPGEMFTTLRDKHFYGLLLALRNLMKPVIAAVNGWALGSGCELAMACDIIIASETATFGLPYVNIGIVSGTALLPRIVGYHKACQLLFTGEPIGAIEAERIGLVNRVVAPEQLHNTAMELARSLAKKPTQLIGWTKCALNKAMSSNLSDAMDYELSAMALTHPSKYIPPLTGKEQSK